MVAAAPDPGSFSKVRIIPYRLQARRVWGFETPQPRKTRTGLWWWSGRPFGKREFGLRDKGPDSACSAHQKPCRDCATALPAPIRRHTTGFGKSLCISDCVVADAVVVEPVSIVGFPANREKNRDFRNSLLFLGPDAARVPMIWGHESRIPYSLEQGFFQKDQGISGSYQGNSVELVERRASIYHASFCLPNVGSQSIPRGRLCANRC